MRGSGQAIGPGAALLVALLAPGLLLGGSARAALLVLAFLVFWVLLPGVGALAVLGKERDGLATVALGLALGLALQGLVLLLCRGTGSFVPHALWPFATLGFWALARRRSEAAGAREPDDARVGLGLVALVVVLVLVRVPTGSGDATTAGTGLESDLLYHAGNAAELTRTGPLLDPRVAGKNLNYHLFAHALPAGASRVTGVPVLELYRSWIAGLYPLVLVLLVFALARELGGSAAAGCIAALALLLHFDLGRGFTGSESPPALIFRNYLDLALFHSPTTAAGLAFLAALALVLVRVLDPRVRPGAGRWSELALLALAASLAKGTVMPVALAALGFAWGLDVLRTRRLGGRTLAALAVATLASLPGTLYLSYAPGSFANVFRVAPFVAVTSSGAGESLLRLARLPRWLPAPLIGPALFPFWLAGFLGLGGLGAVAWLASGRPALRGLGPWFLGVVLTGLAGAVIVLAAGSSELFFAYDAQLVLAVLTGVSAVALWRTRRHAAVVLAVLAAPFLLSGVIGTGRMLRDRRRAEAQPGARWEPWYEGVCWLRDHAEPDALLLARHDGVLLSAFAERRAFLERGDYHPEFHEARWRRVNDRWRLGPGPEHPFPAHEAARERVLAQPDAAALADLRALAAPLGPLYVVCDAVAVVPGRSHAVTIAPRPDCAALEASPLLERCFANEAIAIFRVRSEPR